MFKECGKLYGQPACGVVLRNYPADLDAATQWCVERFGITSLAWRKLGHGRFVFTDAKMAMMFKLAFG